MSRGLRAQEVFKFVFLDVFVNLFIGLLIRAVLGYQLGELGPSVPLSMLHRACD